MGLMYQANAQDLSKFYTMLINICPKCCSLMNEDLKRPLEERYVHGFTSTINGGWVILTANQFLLTHIHLAKTLFVDTTFKCTVGSLKEWEVVMYDKEAECGMQLNLMSKAITIAHAYSDWSDQLQYKTIFDELQHITFQLNGQQLRLNRLLEGGSLISVGVDMELTQALGAGDLFLPTNEPEFSNIHVKTAEEIVEYFVWACYTHAKRQLLTFLGPNHVG